MLFPRHTRVFPLRKTTILWILLGINLGGTGQVILRGPYLQQSSPTSIILHWRTDSACSSKAWYGNSPYSLSDSLLDSVPKTEHILRVTGLNPSSKYYYSVGSISGPIQLPDSNHNFFTHPLPGSNSHFRFWVVGDAGRGTNDQRMVRDGFLFFNNGKKLDGWIWLGDNAYFSGLDSEYQANVFSNNTYENLMNSLVAWAAPGNHDYGQIPANPNPAYLDIFDFPSNGECGGLPSGTEKYFSWDYGNIHFIQLDSYGSDRTDSGAVASWLRADLAQNTSTWIIAYWHHPPYTKGNHDSDNQNGWDPELPQIRAGLVTILEEYGVDLVLNGHSHCYERSRFMDEHYGYSSSLHDSMYVDSTSGCYPASCAYRKDSTGGKGHKGAVYAVVGCSGIYSGVQSDWPHPIMQSAIANELGSMLLEVHENKLQARFVNAFGVVRDSFAIVKHMKVRKVIQACRDSALTLYPTWHEPASWWPVNTTGDSAVIFPAGDTLIVANDTANCLTDTFEIKVVPDSVCALLISAGTMEKEAGFTVFPSPVVRGNNFMVMIKSPELAEKKEITVCDIAGKIILQKKIQSPGTKLSETFLTGDLKPGLYYVIVTSGGKRQARKLVVQ